ncbi:MAG: MTH1187 family thiamine-binding protein [Salinivirgaceae bacterium]|nr:MTH1187 family thiamine-binding protein [Salinivirgaceae bacterium]
MAVLMEFAIFPTDKGKSVSKDVSKVIKMIQESGYKHQLTAMGTLVETPTVAEALHVVEKAAALLQTNSERIYSSIKLDIKKGAENMLVEKVKSIENKLGQ